jgi:hypothetical protein
MEKVDSAYYRKMVEHKKNRLLIRKQALSDFNPTSAIFEFRKSRARSPLRSHPKNNTTNTVLTESLNSEEHTELVNYLQNDPIKQKTPLRSNKLTLLGKLLIHQLGIAKLFNIKP